MSQPIQPQQPTQRPPVPPPQPLPQYVPAKRQKRFGWLALILTGVISLGVGGAVGGSGDGTTTAAPAPTVTVTETADPEPTVTGGQDTEPTTEPTKAPAAWSPKPKDFAVGIKVTKKQCFGSAGCNLSYKVTLDYLGSQKIPSEGTTDITYEITGATDKIVGTLTLNSEGKFDSSEEFTETKSSSSKLVAKVTTVDYNEFG